MIAQLKSVSSKSLATIVGASLVALLSGCATIPMTGSVQLGPDISNASVNDFLYFSPYDPPVGGSIFDILQGFLSAGTGPQNDYAVARKYLANDLKTTWLPNNQVVVVDALPDVTVDAANNRASVLVHPSAFVDEGGRLSVASSESSNEYNFGFVREAGQWRIAKAPNLTIVSRPVFDVVFKNFALFFFDSQNRYLVPDVRWFPSRASTATRLVNGLIAGPDSWLQSAVKNPMPKGTKLAIDAVTISDGIASVDLNSKVLATSSAVKGEIQAQLQATLGQVAGVRSVQISVDRNVQVFPQYSAWDLPSVSLTPVVMTKTSLARLSGTSITAIDGTHTLIQNLKPHDFALTSEGNWVAVSTSQGLYQASLVGFGAEPKLVDPRTNLLSPVFDRQGWLWSVSSSTSPNIKFFDQSGSSGSLLAPDFSGQKILSFAVSPEGARLAVVVSTPLGHEVWLLGIVRSRTGRPVALSGKLVVASQATNPSSISWLDDTTLGILSQSPAGWSQPSEFFIGGFESAVTGMQGLENFIGNKVAGTRFALNTAGDLMQFRSSNWSRVQSGVIKVHFAN